MVKGGGISPEEYRDGFGEELVRIGVVS